MTNPFKDRLKRLHEAHRRGRDTDHGPSGVYTAEDEGTGSEDDTDESTGYGWQQLGATKTTDYGRTLWVKKQRWDHNRSHGDWTRRDCAKVSHRLLTELDDDIPSGIGREELLYMDTETTGLGRDAMAFMVGLGFWSDGDFVVVQMMLEEEEDEPALLEGFAKRLADYELLVTFNGARFDVPLLKRRYEHHGLDHSLGNHPHLDLLPMCRRCFPGLTSYRLSKLEREVLSFVRVDDVPGRDIPRRWWKFLKNRSSELMKPVLEHNHHDVVSMEALVAAAITGEPPQKETSSSTDQKWSFSRLGIRQPRPQQTDHAEQNTSDNSTDTADPAEASKSTSRIAQKLERTYRLRGKFAERGGVTRSRNDQGDPPQEQPPRNSASSEPNEAARRRADSLRAAARPLIDQGMWREAFPMLCELIALVPDDSWGLEMLAEWYRREGNDELADEFERRSRH